MTERKKIFRESLNDISIDDSLKQLKKFDFLLYTVMRNQIQNEGIFEDVFNKVCKQPFCVPVSVLQKLVEVFRAENVSVPAIEVLYDIFSQKEEKDYSFYIDLLLKGMKDDIPSGNIHQVILNSDSPAEALDEMEKVLKLSRTLSISTEKQDVQVISDEFYPMFKANGYGMHSVQVFYPLEPDNTPFIIGTNEDLFVTVENLLNRLKKICFTQRNHLKRAERISVRQAERIKELEAMLSEKEAL